MPERIEHVELVLETVLPVRPKVFGIGFHKTATSSLAHSLYTLGYYVGGYFSVLDVSPGRTLDEHAIDLARQHDALQDMPWPVLYRTLDAEFRDSKFILTVRDPEPWLRSVVTHFGKKNIATHTAIYGVENAAEHPQAYLDRYQQHNQEVLDYFADRPDDLLVIDFAKGDVWNDLCSFLGHDAPPLSVPRQNKRASLREPRFVELARRVVGRLSRSVHRRVAVRRGFIDAPTAWRIVHEHCRRGDALFALWGRLGSDAARSALEPVLVDLCETQIGHLEVLGIIDEVARRRIHEAATPSGAWAHAVLLTRHFVGNLDDEGCRSRIGGTRVSDWVKAMVNDGVGTLQRAREVLRGAGVSLRTEVPATMI